MSAKRVIKQQFMNKVYYLPLASYSTYWDNFTDNATKFNGYNIISMDITDDMNYRIVTDEIVSCGYSVEYLEKKYIPKKYDNIIDYINDTYIYLSIGIIKKMYTGMRQKKDGSYIPLVNYESVKNIIHNHFMDNLTDDIFNTCYMTLWINKDNVVCEDGYYNTGKITNDIIYKMYDNKTGKIEDIKNCNSVYLACYKSISKLLYNMQTKHDKKCIMSLYDTKNMNDEKEYEYTLDSKEYKQAMLEKTEEKVLNNVDTICNNTLEYIKAMEKPFIYEKCVMVMNELKKGALLKDIAKNLDMSKNSVTKYRNIIIDAYKTLYKKYTDDSMTLKEYLQSIKRKKVYISFDFTDCNNTSDKNIIDLCIDTLKYTSSYSHIEQQAMYNELFNAMSTYELSCKIDARKIYGLKWHKNITTYNTEQMYRNELWLDRR